MNPKHYLNIQLLRKTSKDWNTVQDTLHMQRSLGEAKELTWFGWNLLMGKICFGFPNATARG